MIKQTRQDQGSSNGGFSVATASKHFQAASTPYFMWSGPNQLVGLVLFSTWQVPFHTEKEIPGYQNASSQRTPENILIFYWQEVCVTRTESVNSGKGSFVVEYTGVLRVIW